MTLHGGIELVTSPFSYRKCQEALGPFKKLRSIWSLTRQ
jgi:hypothetical protein